MLQEKERQIVELQQGKDQGLPLAPLAPGASESAQLVQLRRDLKDRTAQLTILQQRYDHLDARFKTVRENHEKVLTQMQDLNRAIRDERTDQHGIVQVGKRADDGTKATPTQQGCTTKATPTRKGSTKRPPQK